MHTILVLIIIAVVIAVAVFVLRARIIRWLQRVTVGKPGLRRLLLGGGDTVYAGWRSVVGMPRTRYGIEWRLRELDKLRKPPFVIVGGIYVDVSLSPIAIERLEAHEYYDLDTVVMDCGGSACHVGRYLWSQHHQKSYLFSRIGSGDPFSATLLELLRHERWIRGKELTRSANEQCGVSVHLLQRDKQFYTAFTHMGSLDSFGWEPIMERLHRITKKGGVLYISGYFRTNLHINLNSLRAISPKVLVCIDHGRFNAGHKIPAENALIDAFRERLFDVYICTFDEIKELMEATGLIVDRSLPQEEALERFGRERPLPAITVVRGSSTSDSADAYILFDGKVKHFGGIAPSTGYIETLVGPKNAFNAAFVHALSSCPEGRNVSEMVHDAMARAVAEWNDHR